MRLFLVLFCLVFSSSSVYAERAHFQFLKTVTIPELNAMLNAERAEFLEDAAQGDDYVLPPVSTATNDVDVYTVRYFSKSPELGGKKMLASGLLAVQSRSSDGSLKTWRCCQSRPQSPSSPSKNSRLPPVPTVLRQTRYHP